MTPPERDAEGAEVRLSTGMAVRVRESHEDVVARLSAAHQAGTIGMVRLTRQDGTPVHIVAGHVVLIEPSLPPEPTQPPTA